MKRWAPGDALAGPETSFYLPVGDDVVSVVHHATARPRATVVLAGPMTLERTHGYLTWVRWARVLAANGYDVLRFDYRGVGESTGDFRQQTFETWLEDLRAVVAHARARGHGRVLVLGLRLGALLGKRVFDGRECDAFVAWEPPAGGKPMLMDMLRRKLAADYMEFPGERKTRDDYVAELERGAAVEVEGYPWTKALFLSAAGFGSATPERLGGEYLLVFLDGRPAERLPDRDFSASVRTPRPAFWLQSQNLVADLDALFTLTLERLDIWSDGWLATDATAEAPAVEVVDRCAGRALRVQELGGGRCVGTHHPAAGPVGLLFVNFGYVPRDGHGGLAAHVCEAMAKQGVPCFRYDLPGLGDAPGPLPAKTLEFFPVVTGGSFTPVTAELVRALCAQEGLEGLVVAGLCGGAINALFTADVEPRLVRGLILFEPEMYVTEPRAQDGEAPRRPSLRAALRARLPAAPLFDVVTRALPFEERLRGKLFSYWGWMRLLTHENRYARYAAQEGHPRLRALALGAAVGHQLPARIGLAAVGRGEAPGAGRHRRRKAARGVLRAHPPQAPRSRAPRERGPRAPEDDQPHLHHRRRHRRRQRARAARLAAGVGRSSALSTSPAHAMGAAWGR